ncbi:unnamed protein product [Angiostrongylus costaricensis]|uniref:CD36 family n=1 Tax=Angiostrongylus costaricensis TaxID=334426 RepID=A0A158PJN3_ANGCS|nr:unnamed protein product [Angiostrongylus costaricensis]
MRTCTDVLISALLIVVFLLGLFLLIPFSITLFPAIIRSQVYLRQERDGQFPTATYYWSRLPATQYFKFYYFNVTNPDEVLYKGERARLVELGPYVWNLLTKTGSAIFTVICIFEETNQFRAVTQGGVSFESYSDPLITLIQSNLTKVRLGISFIPLRIYNHTCDEDYVIKTGKDNTDNLALIQKWANMTHLPWWGDNYSSDITNSDGTLQKPGLKKDDNLKQFQSFTCRYTQYKNFFMSFYLHYDSDATINGIQTMAFKMNNDSYDTTADLNKGYRYENNEMVDYFPSWPCGNDHQYTPYAKGCSKIDCTLSQFWCNTCCNGRKILIPFAGFLSPPHFLWSPPEVRENTIGLHPEVEKHEPAIFDIEPLTGSTIKGRFRMQLSIPIYTNPFYTVPPHKYCPYFLLQSFISFCLVFHNFGFLQSRRIISNISICHFVKGLP